MNKSIENLTSNFEKLNNIEQSISKIYVVLYLRSIKLLKQEKVQLFKSYFENQLEFYSQNIEKYKNDYESNLKKYEEMFDIIIQNYNELFVNEQLELQEAESNMKIAILNIIKLNNLKEKISIDDSKSLETINNKIAEYVAKKEKYIAKIDECEEAVEKCMNDLSRIINKVFKDYGCDLVPKSNTIFKKTLKKIVNKFTGASKFNSYVLIPITIENEKIDSVIPDIISDINDKKINFLNALNEIENFMDISA